MYHSHINHLMFHTACLVDFFFCYLGRTPGSLVCDGLDSFKSLSNFYCISIFLRSSANLFSREAT